MLFISEQTMGSGASEPFQATIRAAGEQGRRRCLIAAIGGVSEPIVVWDDTHRTGGPAGVLAR